MRPQRRDSKFLGVARGATPFVRSTPPVASFVSLIASADPMTKLASTLTRTLRKHFKPFYTNFPPGRPLELGDVGFLRDKQFIRQGNLRDIDGISPITVRPDSNGNHYEFSSSGEVSLGFTGKGQVDATGVVAAKAKVDISFSKKRAVFFNAADCTVESIDNLLVVGDEVMSLWREKRWNPRMVIVTTLVRAGNMTLVVSGSSGASIEIQADADAVQDLDLTDAGIGLTARSSKSLAFKSVGETGHNPLLSVSGVRKRFWRPDDFTLKSIAVEGAEANPPWYIDHDCEDECRSGDGAVFGSIE